MGSHLRQLALVGLQHVPDAALMSALARLPMLQVCLQKHLVHLLAVAQHSVCHYKIGRNTTPLQHGASLHGHLGCRPSDIHLITALNSWLQDLAVMFVDGRVVHGRWDGEDEDSDEEDPYTPPAFMQLLDSIAKSCQVSAVVQ
jgi:hypothetical protein